MGFRIIPPGPYAYQNGYWNQPDAQQAQVFMPDHVAEANAQQANQRAIQ
jgi:hypothetical protein